MDCGAEWFATRSAVTNQQQRTNPINETGINLSIKPTERIGAEGELCSDEALGRTSYSGWSPSLIQARFVNLSPKSQMEDDAFDDFVAIVFFGFYSCSLEMAAFPLDLRGFLESKTKHKKVTSQNRPS